MATTVDEPDIGAVAIHAPWGRRTSAARRAHEQRQAAVAGVIEAALEALPVRARVAGVREGQGGDVLTVWSADVSMACCTTAYGRSIRVVRVGSSGSWSVTKP